MILYTIWKEGNRLPLSFENIDDALKHAESIQPMIDNIPTELELRGWFELASVGDTFMADKFTAMIEEV